MYLWHSWPWTAARGVCAPLEGVCEHVGHWCGGVRAPDFYPLSWANINWGGRDIAHIAVVGADFRHWRSDRP